MRKSYWIYEEGGYDGKNVELFYEWIDNIGLLITRRRGGEVIIYADMKVFTHKDGVNAIRIFSDAIESAVKEIANETI